MSLLVLVLVAGAPRAWAQNAPPSEYQLKAAFLFNFTKFIDWPPSSFANPHSRFSICILGADPFGSAMDDAWQGKSIGDRPVAVERLRELAEVRRCQMVFISASEKRRLPEILESLKGAHVLVVGETEGFAAAGGTIQFALENNRVRFLINPDAAERAGLRVSSKLLSLAKIVHDGTSRGGD